MGAVDNWTGDHLAAAVAYTTVIEANLVDFELADDLTWKSCAVATDALVALYDGKAACLAAARETAQIHGLRAPKSCADIDLILAGHMAAEHPTNNNSEDNNK